MSQIRPVQSSAPIHIPQEDNSYGKRFAVFCSKNPKLSTAVKVASYALALTAIAGGLAGAIVIGFDIQTVQHFKTLLDLTGMNFYSAIGYSVGGIALALLSKYISKNNEKHRIEETRRQMRKTMPEKQWNLLPSNLAREISPLGILETLKLFSHKHPKFASRVFWSLLLLTSLTILALAIASATGHGCAFTDLIGMQTTIGLFFYIIGSSIFSLLGIAYKYSNTYENLGDDQSEGLEDENLEKNPDLINLLKRYYFETLDRNDKIYSGRIRFEKLLLEKVLIKHWFRISPADRQDILSNWKLSSNTRQLLKSVKKLEREVVGKTAPIQEQYNLTIAETDQLLNSENISDEDYLRAMVEIDRLLTAKDDDIYEVAMAEIDALLLKASNQYVLKNHMYRPCENDLFKTMEENLNSQFTLNQTPWENIYLNPERL
ncbi:MAG TPA: hypothetical protein VGJ00_00960 [Rhabdochlamydiaceae bacterium]|jgi:hypothetical protein